MSKIQKKHALEIKLLSPTQVATKLGIPTYLASDIMERGEVPTVPIEGKLFVPEDLLEKCMEDNDGDEEIPKISDVSFWDAWRQMRNYVYAYVVHDWEELSSTKEPK